MKPIFLCACFVIFAAGLACAGGHGNNSHLAMSIPQPSTILICMAGMALLKAR